ncbi:MAG TPA: glycine cleavage T C-terminal barrel domain-containing protein [Rhizomicrobium sp.]|nr:glycine cleavage T C-terminal barrel domain-containing protein [Rhizomicrobium sp.]
MSERPFVLATPFHVRAAALNRDNAWAVRNGFTLSAAYDDAGDEALAARQRVVLADISWRWRLAVEGGRAVEFLSRLLTRDPAKLEPGQALKALWLGDKGGVRGACALARYGRESFRVVSAAEDETWIFRAAAAFGLAPAPVADEGGLAIVGPYARATLAAAGLDADLEPLGFRKLFWRGLDVTLSRWGEHGGYEIWCQSDDGLAVWDRLMRAGGDFGIQAAGLAAMDLLDIEGGVARPGRDYLLAREAFAASPSPVALGLERLVDDGWKGFNGREGWLRSRLTEKRRLAGIVFEGETPAPFTPLLREGSAIGHALSSAYSPAMRRAVALAQVDISAIAPGTVLSLTLPPGRDLPELRTAQVRVADLPFLKPPDPIAG